MARDLDLIQPVVQRHAAWLVVNNVQGCPKSCAYCFLRPIHQAPVAPRSVLSARESIDQLRNFNLYHPDTPVCFYTSTDPFATAYVETQLAQVLEEYLSQGIRNPVCFVTKCCPSGRVDKILERFKEEEIPIAAYISYSGLSSRVEKGVSRQAIMSSFAYFRDRSIPIVHYWRPLIPENSDIETMEAVVSCASQFAKAAVVTGIKVYPAMRGQLYFWPELEEQFSSAAKSECVWPTGALERSIYLSRKYDYPLFQSNSCALAYVFGRHNADAIWQTSVCRSFNTCPRNQRDTCRRFYAVHSVVESDVLLALKKVHRYSDAAQVTIVGLSPPIVTVSGIALESSCVAYLREVLHADIVCRYERQNYWGSSVTKDPPYVL